MAATVLQPAPPPAAAHDNNRRRPRRSGRRRPLLAAASVAAAASLLALLVVVLPACAPAFVRPGPSGLGRGRRQLLGPLRAAGGPGDGRKGPPKQQHSQQHSQQQQEARRRSHPQQHQHHQHHHHFDNDDDDDDDSAPPTPAHTRLTGRTYQSLLHAIEAHAADVGSVEELTDALSRLGRLAPSPQALARIAGDPRFDHLLQRITELARQLPPAWAPFVLSNLARFCTRATTGGGGGAASSSSAAPLSPTSNPTVRGLLRALQARVDAGLPTLSPIAMCTVAYSFARLRFHPRPPPSLLAAAAARGDPGGNASAGGGAAVWWRHFVDAVSNRLIEFSPWELCQLLRSLLIVQAALPPGEEVLTPAFVTLLLKCCERQLFTARGFKARDLEGLATSLTKLQLLHKPDPAFVDALVRAATPLLPAARPSTVARLLHALSRLEGHAPSPDFLVAAERACAVTAERWDQSSIALVCQAWSWLRHQPGDATVAALLARARGMLVAGGGGGGGGFSPQNLGTLIVSLGELKRCPDDAWMALFQAAVLARLPEASSKDIGFFLKGLAKLNYYPGGDTVDALLAALTPHLPSLQGVDLQCIVTSLVGLHHRPPVSFIAAFQTRARDLLPPPSPTHAPDKIAPRDLAIILWSFAALEIHAGARPFLHDLAAAAVAQLKAEQPRWGLAEGKPGALSLQERWALTARVRQLRQVYLFAQCRAKEDKELAALLGDFEALGLPAMVEAGLAAGSEELVLQRATESVFHKEVAEVLNSLGALTRRAVDCFVLDVLIEAPSSSSASSDGKAKDQPTAPQQRQQQSPPRSPRPVAAGKKCKGKAPAATTPAAATAASGGSSSPLPILLLLHGPSRFLRGRLAQDEAPKLEAGTHMKQRILQQLSGRRFKQVASVDVWEWARERTREARIDLLRAKIGGRLLDAYLTPPPAAAPSSQAVGNCTLAAP